MARGSPAGEPKAVRLPNRGRAQKRMLTGLQRGTGLTSLGQYRRGLRNGVASGQLPPGKWPRPAAAGQGSSGFGRVEALFGSPIDGFNRRTARSGRTITKLQFVPR